MHSAPLICSLFNVVHTLTPPSPPTTHAHTGDNGSLLFWDWKTGYNFQKHQTTVQPGSLDSEAGIFKCVFDVSGCRMLTAEADKTIKIYKEDDTAVGSLHVECCSLDLEV